MKNSTNKTVETRSDAGDKPLRQLPGATTLGTISALSTISSDLSRPLCNTMPFVFIIIVFLMAAIGMVYRRSGDKRYLTWIFILILPACLCLYAFYHSAFDGKGQPNSGVIAATLPAVEQIQSRILPIKASEREKLQLDATLKGGTDEEKLAAIQRISVQPELTFQLYLYKLVAKSGSEDQRQWVLFVILRKQLSQNLPIEVRSQLKGSAFSTALDVASIYFVGFNADGFDVSANVRMGLPSFSFQGKVSGSELRMTGVATIKSVQYPTVLSVTMDQNLVLLGAIHFAGGEDVPIKIQPF